MKITVEVDSLAELHAFATQFAGGAPGDAKPAKKPKPVEPVAGNPDVKETPPAAVVAEKPATPVTSAANLAADTPDEIKKLLTDTSKAALGPAILKASKEKEIGGRGRAAAVAILEKYRPAGNTAALVKVSDIPVGEYPKIAADILALYAA